MPGKLRNLPRSQRVENLSRQLPRAFLKALDLAVDIDLAVVADEPQLFDFCLKLRDGLLEIQELEIM